MWVRDADAPKGKLVALDMPVGRTVRDGGPQSIHVYIMPRAPTASVHLAVRQRSRRQFDSRGDVLADDEHGRERADRDRGGREGLCHVGAWGLV